MNDKDKQTITQKTVFGTAWVFAEKMLAQAASFVVSIFLSRLLFPEDYGIVALASIFLTISSVFIDCGFGAALVQKKNPEKVDYSTAFSASLLISVVLFILLICLARPIALYFGTKYNTDIIVNVIRLMALKLPIGAYMSVQNAYIQKKFMFKTAFWGSLFGTVTSGIFGVISAYIGFGAYSLVIQTLSDSIIDAVLITIAIKWLPGIQISLASFRALFGYGSKFFLTTLVDKCNNSLTDFVIGKRYTAADLALYNKGKQLPYLVWVNIEGSLSKALFPAMSSLQDHKEELKNAIRKSIQVSSYIIFPALIGLMCVGDTLIVALFTEKWRGCVPYIIMMCVAYLTTSIRVPILQAINAVGRSDIYLKLDIIKQVVGVLSLAVSYRYGPFWICFSYVCSSFAGLVIIFFPCKKIFNLKITEVVADMLPTVCISIIMGIIVIIPQLIIQSKIILLAIQIALGVSTYILLSIISNNKAYIYLLAIVNNTLLKAQNGNNKQI